MRSICVFQLFAILSTAYGQGASTSSKRGLVYIPSDKHPSDDSIWDSPTSDLTWYYNYQAAPSPAYSNSTKLQFVPMLFGASDTDSKTATPFLDAVRSQIKEGADIKYVLGFNEPDGRENGGSNVPVDLAAETWIREIEPLKKLGVKLGAPAVTGAPTGFAWLQNFFSACNGRCSIDFIPVHWYGNFEGFASHIGEIKGAYPNVTVWVTEYANNDVSLSESQVFYNASSQFLDRVDYVTHYSYFGSFRSDVSNVGPYSAMLTQSGKLTDIGSWYLGGVKTGNKPKGAASRTLVSAGTIFFVGLVSLWCWL